VNDLPEQVARDRDAQRGAERAEASDRYVDLIRRTIIAGGLDLGR
jgi:hypothetical protein